MESPIAVTLPTTSPWAGRRSGGLEHERAGCFPGTVVVVDEVPVTSVLLVVSWWCAAVDPGTEVVVGAAVAELVEAACGVDELQAAKRIEHVARRAAAAGRALRRRRAARGARGEKAERLMDSSGILEVEGPEG